MNQNEKIKMIQNDVLIVGIDAAKRTHWFQPMLNNGYLLGKPFKIKNNREDFESLLTKIESIKQSNHCHTVIFGIESTGHYWKPLASYLIANSYTVVGVNPFHVKRSKEIDDNTQTKSDPKDCRVIGRLVSQGSFFEIYLPTGIWAELRDLSNTRKQIRNRMNSILNQIRAILDEHFPEYESVFSNITGKTALHILSYCPMPEDLINLGVLGIVAEIHKSVKKGVGQKKATLLYEAAIRSIGVPASQVIRQKMKLYIDSIVHLTNQIAFIEQEMENQLKATEMGESLLEIKGIGVVTLAGFLGEIGDPRRFKDWKQIRKLSGYNLVETSSGEHRGRRSISKRGRPALRSYLYQMALMVSVKNKEFRQIYRYLITRRQNPLRSKQALIAVAMKLIRVIWTLTIKKVTYDPSKVLGEYRLGQLKEVA
jgi:transposase